MNAALRAMLTAAVGIAALSTAPASAQDTRNQGYLVDQNYNVVTSGTGLCWRTSDWTPARAAAAEAVGICDKDLAPKPRPKPAAAPAPAPAAKKETPKPPGKQAVPGKPAPQKINFSADALFDFDKAELKPQGKAMLDDLTRALQGAKFEVILAIGHTDRIGSVQYNQQLSEKRAAAVKKYLVDKGIESSRIHAQGKGKSQPLTKASDCKLKDRKALIACLQPDRRVAVEVSGAK